MIQRRRLFFSAIIVTMSAHLLVKADDRILSPLLCGANQGCNVAGIYYGTMPKENPASRRADFIKILKEKKIHAIRFPGGTFANLYLAENQGLMQHIPGLEYASFPETNNRDLVTPWQFFDLCREAGIEPIYQLNTLLFTENDSIFLLADTRVDRLHDHELLWGGPKVILDTGKRGAAAEAVAAFVARTLEKGYKVRHWELGNEEYGGPRIDPKDYADIAVRFTRAIHESDSTAMVWITLGDNQMRHSVNTFRKWSETLLSELSTSEMQQEKNWAFTLHYVWPEIIDALAKIVNKYGFKPRFAITEFHLAGDGDYSDLSPRFGYALALAKYLIKMAPDPRIEMLMIHDLVSQNFGILHYNAISYGLPDMTTWDPKRGYEAMPSAEVYAFFGELIGGAVVPINNGCLSNSLTVNNNGELRILHVNDGARSEVITLTRDIIGIKNSRYECASLIPEGHKTESPLRRDKCSIVKQEGSILPGRFNITVPPRSVNYFRLFSSTTTRG